MTKRLIVILYMVFSLSFITCERYTIERPEIDDSVKIDFVTEIIPIFEKDCQLCHSGGQTPVLTTANAYNSIIDGDYVDILNPESSKLYSVLLNTGTHSGRTSQGNIQIILVWISQGAKYSVDGTSPDSIPDNVDLSISFWNQIIPIFENNSCTDCHGTGQVPPNLTSGNAYASLIENNLIDTITPANSKLYTALAGSHKNHVTGAETDTILAWIELGAIDDTPPQIVSLSQHLQPIFDAECIMCHSSGSFLDLTSGASYNTLIYGAYVDTTNAEESLLYKTFIGAGSHVGRTSESNVQLFLSWIEDGAPDN